jgi:hypothetical protein
MTLQALADIATGRTAEPARLAPKDAATLASMRRIIAEATGQARKAEGRMKNAEAAGPAPVSSFRVLPSSFAPPPWTAPASG